VSISAPRYAAAPVPRTGRGSRVLAIAGREFYRRAVWGTLLAVGLTYATMILVTVVSVWIASLTGSLTPASFDAVFGSPVWPLLMLIVATAAGAGSIAEDVGNRSFTLYRSRPIFLVDYLAAKTIACGAWMLVAAVGPGLSAVGVAAALGYASPTVALDAAGAFAATGCLAAVFFTGLALALSSLTDRALYAGVTIFGLVLSLYIGAAVVLSLTGNTYVLYGSPLDDLHAVVLGAFASPGAPATSPGGSAVVLAGAGVGLWALAGERLGRIEVVAE